MPVFVQARAQRAPRLRLERINLRALLPVHHLVAAGHVLAACCGLFDEDGYNHNVSNSI
jgi:hypothetical protein